MTTTGEMLENPVTGERILIPLVGQKVAALEKPRIRLPAIQSAARAHGRRERGGPALCRWHEASRGRRASEGVACSKAKRTNGTRKAVCGKTACTV